MERKDIGSWLEGPPQLNAQEWPGQRLGRPEKGPGSIGRFPRRVGAIIIDWALAMLVSWWLFESSSLATLLLFCAGQMLTVGFTGHSIGHRTFGMQVQSMDGTAIKPWVGALRSLLLCLVIPALVADADQRGLHDRAGKSVLVNVR
ncbi:RDD family protein [Glutamicibacter sp. MNS18]|uniref:RDD family protein n=1 Tax=Glutamicibacter sp. MNS18 TaxID=2989817 RepID=UPI002235AF5F|nr:RDD family protein [Glutamicibacter sp. MNS18]MCW4464441.1 RDD family protein [Glutamicibacter sp. MNS18]